MNTAVLRKTLGLLAAGLTVMGIMSQAASAATVQFNNSSLAAPTEVDPGSPVTLNLQGLEFPAATDGGAFEVTWDPAVLSFSSFTVAAPWDSPAFVQNSNPTDGKLDFVFLTYSPAGGVGTSFDIGTFVFSVIGSAGTSSTVALADVFGGWAANGTGAISGVTYNAGSVQVAALATPVPPAVWLFGSALAAFTIIGRRGKV